MRSIGYTARLVRPVEAGIIKDDHAMTDIKRNSATRIVGIGGTLRADSTTEHAVRDILRRTAASGAEVRMFSGSSLNFPMYVPGAVDSTPAISDFIMELRRAHAVVIGSPAYHGGISGLIKNALDYVQEMSDDGAPYFTGRAIGCIATGRGWQGTNSTLAAIRDIAHALRGWPTSLGIALNSCEPLFNERGECTRPEVENQLQTLAGQLLWFCRGDSRPESSLDREADSC